MSQRVLTSHEQFEGTLSVANRTLGRRVFLCPETLVGSRTVH
jgi:hypothetical protein